MTEEKNIYYNPEKFGLEIVTVLDADLSYGYSIYVVFKDKNGNYFWLHDNGCSCPTPFENMTKLELVPLTFNNCFILQDIVMRDVYGFKPEQAQYFISKVQELFINKGRR